ncbi:GxxExxY protein [Asticcacaulis sp. AC402]|uniref:GxxExxY protein n=1 Tax=Asticcacaulis sp. AC402 TaxID=1282361 RepID=UPI0003C3C560|nr:GxxExxY protein [Asticcacaulis sp. AC402]ESQ75011.1 NADH:ubiquinone oxidoreductase subunit 5 [Asticcacaulis sp. AC402]
MTTDRRDSQTYAIIGAAMEVHTRLGYGFLEAVYHEALMIELDRAGIPFRREFALPIHYRDTVLACQYRADFICFDEVLVELKALVQLSPREDAQIMNYLRAARLPKGLLINFGGAKLEYKRFKS